MADITVRGYVNRLQIKDGRNGRLVTFSLAEKVKDQHGPNGKGNRYWDVICDETAFPTGAEYVEVTGYSDKAPRIYQGKNGPGVSQSLNAKTVTVPERKDAGKPRGGGGRDTGWAKDDTDEIPF